MPKQVSDTSSSIYDARHNVSDTSSNGASLGDRSASSIRLGLEIYNARLALSVADSFAGTMEVLRRLDFDDRPRAELSAAELEQFIADNDVARDLLVFAASDACLAVRQWRLQTANL